VLVEVLSRPPNRALSFSASVVGGGAPERALRHSRARSFRRRDGAGINHSLEILGSIPNEPADPHMRQLEPLDRGAGTAENPLNVSPREELRRPRLRLLGIHGSYRSTKRTCEPNKCGGNGR
jgi:hypothetical protein